MNRYRLRFGALAVSISLCLACGGVLEPPEPEPEPRPDPAENADQCKKWKGAALPMNNGIIVKCAKKSVSIDHDEDGRPWRWEYVELYKKKGWSISEPETGNPVATKGEEKLTFLSSGNEVTIQSEGGGGGKGGKGGKRR